MSRPEHIAPPELFYNEQEAKKYGFNSHMIKTQTALATRAIDLMMIPEGQPSYILDIGTGSGLSGEVLTEHGYQWIGIDISKSMLGVALEREVEGDLVCSDMGQGMVFRPGTFDGCISISALQWLCNADQSCHNPRKRLKRFFTSLYSALVTGARAVFQFYPENPDQLAMIQYAALQAGFNGGLVVDYPNSTRAKKYFLCLFAGETSQSAKRYVLPKGLTDEQDDDADEDDEEEQIQVLDRIDKRRQGKKPTREKKEVSRKEWLLKRKAKLRAKGVEVPPDTKRTGRMPRVKW